MRELPKIIPDHPPVQVFNPIPGDDELHKQAIFVVPHLDLSGTYRVRVYHAEFFFSVTHAAKGWVGTEAGLDAVVLKDFELASKQDPQKQVDGYLALIRQTSGPPITVASVGLPNFEHVGSVAMGRLAFDTYLVAYFGENREQLAHSMHEASSRVYGLRTLRGLARLLLNRPVTVTV